MKKEGKSVLVVFICLFALIFVMYFVLAAHTITPASFSFNESVNSLYNITVNNTDSVVAANITQVNVTLPSGASCTIISDSNGTDSVATFTNTSSVLTWSNTTYVVNASVANYFWFNATCTAPGSYNITVTTVNATDSYDSNISLEINDTTNPTASFGTNPVNAFNDSDGSITFDLMCSDNYNVSVLELWTNSTGTWHANYTNSSPSNDTFVNVTVANMGDGDYIWAVYCNDSAGNEDWTDTNRSFTVDSSGPTASFGTNPVNAVNDSDGSIIFDLKCFDDINVDTLELWTNSTGTWHANYTNSSPSNDTFVNVTVANMGDGDYIWAVYCNDSAGNEDWTDTNRSFTVDSTAPTVAHSCSPASVTAGDVVTCSCSRSDATSGVSTTSYVVNPSTSSTGTFTTTCTVTDYAGNSGSSSFSYIVENPGSASSSSSGGGSSAAILTKKVQSWVKISPGEATIMKDFDSKIGVKQIQIEVNNEANNVKITVTKYDNKPAGVTKEKTGKVHKYLQITTQNLEDKLKKGIVKIQVEKSWVSGNTLNKEDIAMFKFNAESEQWEELTTTYTEEDASYYYYDVELSSFSYFAISGEAKAEPAEEVVQDDQPSITGEAVEDEITEEGLDWWVWALIIVVILLIIFLIIFTTRKARK